VRVLVVDDSIVFRSAVRIAIGDMPEINELKVASNGKIAVEFTKAGGIDFIIMDLEMPVMDGIDAIKAIREFNKTIPIIIFSVQSIKGANKTLKALEYGANDFVQKIPGGKSAKENVDNIKNDLIPRIKALCLRRAIPIGSPSTGNTTEKSVSHSSSVLNTDSIDLKKYSMVRPSLILIGSSTGGPEALKKVFSQLKSHVKVPILVIQHMPPIFTEQLAKMLNKLCPLTIIEASDGDLLRPGHCYIAPGDYHMTIFENGLNKMIKLNQDPKVCYVRPSVDVTFNSAAANIRGKLVSFVLTGMGSDGVAGAKSIKDKNGFVLIQDEQTSVVWGMPGAVHREDLQDDMGTLDQLAQVINEIGH
jgi:two-component system, chemotaxis family, protein-glutamate methylesterase/glutaminase